MSSMVLPPFDVSRPRHLTSNPSYTSASTDSSMHEESGLYPSSAVIPPSPPAGLHPQQAHVRSTHRMPIRGSFHIATGHAFHQAESETEAALQGPSARFETNDGYVDVRIWVSGGAGMATIEASSKSGRVKVEVVDCPARLPLRLAARSTKGSVEVLLPPCFAGLLVVDSPTVNLSDSVQRRTEASRPNQFIIQGLDGIARGGSEVKVEARLGTCRVAFAREDEWDADPPQ